MKCNIGKKDRAIRFGAGIAIVLAGVAYGSWFGIIGVIFIATSIIKFCPAYVPFKIDTSKNDDSSCNSKGGSGCGCNR